MIGGLLAFAGVFFLVTPRAWAGGADETTQTLLGWTPDGQRFVVHRVSSMEGCGAVVIRDLVTGKTREIGGSPDACVLEAAKARTLRAVKALKLRLGSFTRPGWQARIRRIHHRVFFEVKSTAMARWRTLGSLGLIHCGTCTAKVNYLGVIWEPGGRAVALKIYYSRNYGDPNTNVTRSYHAFWLAPRTGLTRDQATWRQGRRRLGLTIRTTSTLFEGRATRYRPRNLLSGRAPWCEGAAGTGVGQRITYRFAVPVRIRGFRVQPGFHWTAALWKRNNRVKQLRVTLGDGRSKTVTFADARRTFTLALPPSRKRVRRATFEIRSVYPGESRKTDDTCITQIIPY